MIPHQLAEYHWVSIRVSKFNVCLLYKGDPEFTGLVSYFVYFFIYFNESFNNHSSVWALVIFFVATATHTTVCRGGVIILNQFYQSSIVSLHFKHAILAPAQVWCNWHYWMLFINFMTSIKASTRKQHEFKQYYPFSVMACRSHADHGFHW